MLHRQRCLSRTNVLPISAGWQGDNSASEILPLLPRPRSLSAWLQKAAWPQRSKEEGSGSAVLAMKDRGEVLTSKCPGKRWYKPNCVDSQDCRTFYLKSIIFIFSHLDAFSEHFLVSDKIRHQPSNPTKVKTPSDLSYLSLPKTVFSLHSSFYKRLGELGGSQIFWWYLNKLKFSSSLLAHMRQRTSSAATLLGEKGQRSGLSIRIL